MPGLEVGYLMGGFDREDIFRYEAGSSRHHRRARTGGLQRGRFDRSSLHSGSRRRIRLPQCDFTGAEVTSKAFSQDGRLILTADITGAVCPWHESNGQFVPTTFEVRYEGTAAPTS